MHVPLPADRSGLQGNEDCKGKERMLEDWRGSWIGPEGAMEQMEQMEHSSRPRRLSATWS